MKYLRLALVIFASALAVAHAQQDQDEERRAPPVEIPDFSNLDEYIYEPRSTVQFGFRYLSGAKASFFGHGSILSPDDLTSDSTTPNITRTYHDGYVRPDGRPTTLVDSSGNPVVDPNSGQTGTQPVAPDGKTNTWQLTDSRQVGDPTRGLNDVPNGYVAFHSYSADVTDDTIRQKKTKTNSGMDISVVRDMGKLFHGRVSWNLIAGMSVNDISARTTSAVQANVTTITDYYPSYGQTVPITSLPYTAPSTTQQTVLDANGNAVTNSDGSVQTVSVDNSVLIGNVPALRTTANGVNITSVVNQWVVKGAYFTFRFGPEVLIPITSRLRIELSAGPALIYSGTAYTVNQTFTPDIGADITESDTNTVYKLRPGYFADASLQFDLTDKAGFFAGAVFQSASGYTQSLDTATAKYATKIDLSDQSGVRAGMSIRF
ncbi:MAG TPA: hypothetical protein VHE61_23425 [Opitutaceae bacterium]|nr:hypothetical protein [Opitutaceae bacterium]